MFREVHRVTISMGNSLFSPFPQFLLGTSLLVPLFVTTVRCSDHLVHHRRTVSSDFQCWSVARLFLLHTFFILRFLLGVSNGEFGTAQQSFFLNSRFSPGSLTSVLTRHICAVHFDHSAHRTTNAHGSRNAVIFVSEKSLVIWCGLPP